MVLSSGEVGKLIKAAREMKSQQTGQRYTQIMLANDIGISRSYLGDIETGRTYPSYKLLSKIGEACGVPLNFFSELEKGIDKYVAEQFSEYDSDTQQMVKGFIRQRDDVNLEFLSGQGVDKLKLMGIPTKDSVLDMERVKSYDIESLPIVGAIRCGEPLLAAHNIEGYFPTDRRFLSSDRQYFYLRVKGDSMDREFQEGSLLLIQKQSYIENGQIGVVLIDNEEATVKRIYVSEGIMTLVPCSNNPKHQPRTINMEKEEAIIVGKVALAVKKY